MPQNGQTDSNNSSAICRRNVWVCLTIFVKLGLKGLTSISVYLPGYFKSRQGLLEIGAPLTNWANYHKSVYNNNKYARWSISFYRVFILLCFDPYILWSKTGKWRRDSPFAYQVLEFFRQKPEADTEYVL